MELGRRQELVILTPMEVGWVRRALASNGPHPMADMALKNGTGRTLTCTAVEADCKEPVTHWWVTNEDQLVGCCKEHWREQDPDNSLALNTEEKGETGKKDDEAGKASDTGVANN